jgi:hypothetical protein
MKYYTTPTSEDELYHFGILGMKWGVRRYQNSDGTLTEAGKKHYAKIETKKEKKRIKRRVRAAGLVKSAVKLTAGAVKTANSAISKEQKIAAAVAVAPAVIAAATPVVNGILATTGASAAVSGALASSGASELISSGIAAASNYTSLPVSDIVTQGGALVEQLISKGAL